MTKNVPLQFVRNFKTVAIGLRLMNDEVVFKNAETEKLKRITVLVFGNWNLELYSTVEYCKV